MWLFDNLFLDKNTPVTINDGVDHSKDVVSSGSSRGSIKEKTSEEVISTPPEKKGDEFDTLFDSKKKKEQTEKPKEPEKDIALEIWLPPEVPSSADTTSSSSPTDTWFDIGGDLSFDIWGIDSPATLETWEQSLPIEISWTLPWALSDSSAPVVSELSETLPVTSSEAQSFVSIDPIPPTPEDMASVNSVEISNLSDTSNPADNALFSLLNEDTPQTNIETTPESLPVSENASSLETGNFLSDLTGDTSPALVPEAWVPEATVPTITIEEPISWEVSTESSHSLESDIFTISPTKEVTEESIETLDALPGKRLKGKLGDFITELQLLDKDDQSERQKREEQIHMLEERIWALRQEQEALKQEILQMDNEKNHIKSIITTFREQLETR